MIRLEKVFVDGGTEALAYCVTEIISKDRTKRVFYTGSLIQCLCIIGAHHELPDVSFAELNAMTEGFLGDLTNV